MVITYSVMALWTVCYLCDLLFGWMPLLSGSGFAAMGDQYHRLISGILLHGNALHLLANTSTLFWIGTLLEKQVGSKRFLHFTLTATLLAQLDYFALFPQIDHVFGGSILIFAYIGWIIALQIRWADFPRLTLGTWRGNWIWCYAIAGNLPMFSFMNLSTVALHGISLLIGAGIGTLIPRRMP